MSAAVYQRVTREGVMLSTVPATVPMTVPAPRNTVASGAHRLARLTDGAVVQRKLRTNLKQWDNNVQTADAFRGLMRVLYKTPEGSDAGKWPIDEINTAYWATKAKQEVVNQVETHRKQLWTAKAAFEKTLGEPNKAFDIATATTHWMEIVEHTNYILDNGTTEQPKEWKVQAVRPGSTVPIVTVGAAVAALVAVPATEADKPPTPKKLQLSLDRHYWGRLKDTSETKAQNTMIRHDVSEFKVYEDLRVLAAEYLKRMGEGKTAKFNCDSADGERTYLVEGLSNEEPHVYPVSGTQTVDVPEKMHKVLKLYKHSDPAGSGNAAWDTLVALIKTEGVKPADLYEKMAALKLPKKQISDLETEWDKRNPPPKVVAPKPAPKPSAKKK